MSNTLREEWAEVCAERDRLREENSRLLLLLEAEGLPRDMEHAVAERDAAKAENARLARALASGEPLARAAVAFAAARADIQRTPRTVDAAVRTLHEAAQRHADLPPASDNAAIPQPAPDVQAVLAKALDDLRAAVVADNWMGIPAALDAADAALLLVGRKP